MLFRLTHTSMILRLTRLQKLEKHSMTSLPSTGSRRALCGQAAGAGAVGHAPKMSSMVTFGSGHAGCCHLWPMSPWVARHKTEMRPRPAPRLCEAKTPEANSIAFPAPWVPNWEVVHWVVSEEIFLKCSQGLRTSKNTNPLYYSLFLDPGWCRMYDEVAPTEACLLKMIPETGVACLWLHWANCKR